MHPKTLCAKAAAITVATLLCMQCADAFGNKTAVSLDLQNPDRSLDAQLEPYMIALRKRVQRLWTPANLSPTLKAKIFFQIERDGSISAANIVQSSGVKSFDESALDAAYEATPYPKIPMRHLQIVAAFDSKYLSPVDLSENISRRTARQPQREQPDEKAHYIAENAQEDEPIRVARPTRGSPSQREPDVDEQPIEAQSSLPEPSPMPTGKPPNNLMDGRWAKPLNRNQFAQLAPDEANEYRQWFKEYLSQPSSAIFGFLTTNVQTPAVAKAQSLRARAR